MIFILMIQSQYPWVIFLSTEKILCCLKSAQIWITTLLTCMPITLRLDGCTVLGLFRIISIIWVLNLYIDTTAEIRMSMDAQESHLVQVDLWSNSVENPIMAIVWQAGTLCFEHYPQPLPMPILWHSKIKRSCDVFAVNLIPVPYHMNRTYLYFGNVKL